MTEGTPDAVTELPRLLPPRRRRSDGKRRTTGTRTPTGTAGCRTATARAS